MFVDEFYKKSYFNKLATAIIKFSDEKPEDILCSCCGGILVLYHNGYARKRHKKESTSEFKDFEVLSIYDREPTIQDQLTYINVMCEIFKDKNYFEKAFGVKPFSRKGLVGCGATPHVNCSTNLKSTKKHRAKELILTRWLTDT